MGRASAFAGPFNESTAVFLCAGGGMEPHQVPSLLAQLAAFNVLEPVRNPGGLRRPRYRMTRAARDFGAERLREAAECEVTLERRAGRLPGHPARTPGTAQTFTGPYDAEGAVAPAPAERGADQRAVRVWT